MVCNICNNIIKKEISFYNLFCFDFICEKCQKRIERKETIYPIDNGFLLHEYYYVTESSYEDNFIEYISEDILDILNNSINKIVLLFPLDELFILKYLDLYKDIVLITVSYIELYDYLDDF